MKLIPQDLGLHWRLRLMQARENPANVGADLPHPRLGPLARWYSKNTGLSEEEAAAVVPVCPTSLTGTALAVSFLGWMGLFFSMLILSKVAGIERDIAIPLVFLGSPVLAVIAGIWCARKRFEGILVRPIGAGEANLLLEKTADPLHRQFLELVRDVVVQPAPPQAEANLREALRALADTIASLPVLEHRPLDTAALRQEAQELFAQAATQPDRVTSESIERRASAILYRVDSHERSALMAQRNDALRREVEAQMHAMREGLTTLQASSADPLAFAVLATSARQVASEAVAMAAARDELEEAVGAWAPKTPGTAASGKLTQDAPVAIVEVGSH